MEGLKLRGEPDPVKVLEVMKSIGFVAALEDRQRETISYCENWIALNRPEIVYCIQRRKKILLYERELKEPTSFPLFHSTLDRVHRYEECLKALGSQWIGLRSHFLVLWEIIDSRKEE